MWDLGLHPNANLRAALEATRASISPAQVRENDPVGWVHKYGRPDDQEIAGLVAASVAYGRVPAIRGLLDEIAERLGPDLARMVDSGRAESAVRSVYYRFQAPGDFSHFFRALRRLRGRFGSLQRAFHFCVSPKESDYRFALRRFSRLLRAATGLKESNMPYGVGYLVSKPTGAGAMKRLCLFLRWMVRPEDGIDVGTWSARFSAARLLMPLDTHVVRIARYLGLLTRESVDGRAAIELTARLRSLCPVDPLRYDAAICHLGISGMCTANRAPHCEDCALRPHCGRFAAL